MSECEHSQRAFWGLWRDLDSGEVRGLERCQACGAILSRAQVHVYVGGTLARAKALGGWSLTQLGALLWTKGRTLEHWVIGARRAPWWAVPAVAALLRRAAGRSG